MQETFLRAWRSPAGSTGRAGRSRTWLYRIATNACLTTCEGRNAARCPLDLSGRPICRTSRRSSERPESRGSSRSPTRWCPRPGIRSAVVVARESMRLAFLAALQHLPPRQRAVLILRDVLALAGGGGRRAPGDDRRLGQQRAPAGARPARGGVAVGGRTAWSSRRTRRPGNCWTATRPRSRRMDVEALKGTLREDALLQMPPFGEWLLRPGRDRRVPRHGLRPRRLVPLHARRGRTARPPWASTAAGTTTRTGSTRCRS